MGRASAPEGSNPSLSANTSWKVNPKAGDGIGLENRRGLIAPWEFDPPTFRHIFTRKLITILPDDYVVPVPAGVTLLGHQDANIRYAAGRKVTLIADPPGLGKTLSTIALINCFQPKRVLIICPASLKLNWAREWQKYTVHDSLGVSVVSSKRCVVDSVTIVNYDLIDKFHDILVAEQWDFLILDEAHYVKNPDAKRTKLIFGKKSKRNPIQGLKYKRLLLLTGTPMTNRPIDLWNFCQVADPKGLGKDYFSFVKRYCAAWNSPWGLDVSGASNLEELGNKLRAAFMIRHDKGLLNLPPKIHTLIEMPTDGLGVERLLKREADLYESLKRAGVPLEYEDFDEQVAKLAKTKNPDVVQTAADLAATRQEIALKKLPMMLSFVENLVGQGEKVVVFSYHRAIVKAVAEHFGDSCVTVMGGMSAESKQHAVDSFQTDPKTTVFNGQMIAAGVGLTLTASRSAVFFEIDYVPAVLEQAEDRIHRISQDRIANIYYLMLEGSNDAKIIRDVVKKRENISKVLLV